MFTLVYLHQRSFGFTLSSHTSYRSTSSKKNIFHATKLFFFRGRIHGLPTNMGKLLIELPSLLVFVLLFSIVFTASIRRKITTVRDEQTTYRNLVAHSDDVGLLEINGPEQHMDFRIPVVNIETWDETGTQDYNEIIKSRPVFNEKFVARAAKLSPGNNSAESIANNIAQKIYKRSVRGRRIPRRLNKAWKQLKKRLLNEKRKNRAVLVFNDIPKDEKKKSWTFCAVVMKWK